MFFSIIACLFHSPQATYVWTYGAVFQHGGIERRFTIYGPADTTVAINGVYVFLHGGGGEAPDGFGALQSAPTYEYVAVFPYAKPPATGSAYSCFWNSGEPDHGDPNIDDVAFVEALARAVNTNYTSSGSRKNIAMGYSQGAAFATRLACESTYFDGVGIAMNYFRCNLPWVSTSCPNSGGSM